MTHHDVDNFWNNPRNFCGILSWVRTYDMMATGFGENQFVGRRNTRQSRSYHCIRVYYKQKGISGKL